MRVFFILIVNQVNDYLMRFFLSERSKQLTLTV